MIIHATQSISPSIYLLMIDKDRLVVVDVLNFNAHQPGGAFHLVFSLGRVAGHHRQRVGPMNIRERLTTLTELPTGHCEIGTRWY